MKAYHAGRMLVVAGALAALVLAGCAKGCTEGEAPLATGTAPSAGAARLAYASPSASASLERFLARRARSLGLAFYRVSSTSGGASVELDRSAVAAIKRDVDGALRIDVYVVDDATRAFAGREAEVPFPGLADGTGLRIANEHRASLERFASSVAPPANRRILVGSSGGDEFAHTWIVVTPPIVGGESVAQLDVASESGAWGVALHLDDAGRAALDDRARESAGARVALVIDGRVRGAVAAKSALDGARAFVALGADAAAKTEAQSYAARFGGAARATDLALTREE